MLSWAGLTGGSGQVVIECGFEDLGVFAPPSGVVGSRPQYLISSPNGMSQLTMVATINEGSTGVLDCDVITNDVTGGNVYVKWTGGIGHSVSNADTPNNFVATTSTTVA
jgi:hypothetical protein